ncbi:glycosyltransferase family 2 protein [Chitinispirillales bacterium ANBcel5]|uniref:glycosyltransferase family 2 protein n=1 Tax=Cellulosispirillum alkaliphilum TaxID=3039283 RepID=UPI002A52B757|nr:glycosyltransferase family 2 protein [Chitinispirillales bacterium ANBcel5]
MTSYPKNSTNNLPLVSLLILNWNGEDLLEECIDSLRKTEYCAIEIIIVDNASTDKSVEIISQYKDIRLVVNSTNLGYSAGNNVGFQHARGKYVVTLNNDMIVEPNWLNSPIKFLEKNPGIGVISCRQMNYYCREKIDGLYHTIKADLSLMPYGFKTTFNSNMTLTSKPGYVISANGGSAIIRKSLIDQLGGFDPDFFAYMEETDFCLRAFLHGWKCLYDPEAVVYHREGYSFKKINALRYYYRERNRIWLLYKNYPTQLLLKRSLFILLMELRVIRVFLLKLGKPGLYLKARIDAFRGLKRYKEIRNENVSLFKIHKKEFLNFQQRKKIEIS